jgi:hypothetical protein
MVAVLLLLLLLLLLIEAGLLWAPLRIRNMCSMSAWTFAGVEQRALGCG